MPALGEEHDSEEEIILELQSSDAGSSSDDYSCSDDDAKTKRRKKESPQSSSTENASVWKTTLNIINFIEGVGFLALPFAVKTGGITAIVAFLLVLIFYCYTGHILIECLYDNDEKRGKLRVRSNYKELGDILSPKYGGYFIQALQQLALYLVAVSYLVACGSLLHHAFPFVPLNEAMWTGIAGLIVLPTVFLKSLSQIAWLSSVSVFALAAVLVGMLWYAAEHTREWDVRSLLFWDTQGVFVSVTIIIFSYGAAVFPSVEGSMADKSKFDRALNFAYLINTVFKVGFAFLGFLSFGFKTDEVVVNNFPAGPIRITISVIFVLSCLLSYALPVNVIFEYLDQTATVLNVSTKLNDLFIHIAIRVTVVASTILVAMFMPHFALVLSFSGSICATIPDLIFPCVVHLKLRYHELKSCQILIELLLAAFGVIAMVFGVSFSVKAMFDAL